MVLRARNVSGAFEKRAPGPSINRSFEEARFIRRGKITRDFHARTLVPQTSDKIKQLAILSLPGRIFEPGFGNNPLARITSTSNIPFLLYSPS